MQGSANWEIGMCRCQVWRRLMYGYLWVGRFTDFPLPSNDLDENMVEFPDGLIACHLSCLRNVKYGRL